MQDYLGRPLTPLLLTPFTRVRSINSRQGTPDGKMGVTGSCSGGTIYNRVPSYPMARIVWDDGTHGWAWQDELERCDSAARCHCGSRYDGSDHCPSCGCEQYESINVRDCGHVHKAG